MRRLAEGCPACADLELRCCADRLLSRRGRLRLAVALERLVADAQQPRTTLTSAVPLNRAAIIEQEPTLLGLIVALRSEATLAVRGLALLECMLTDLESPFYVLDEPLGSALDRVREALRR